MKTEAEIETIAKEKTVLLACELKRFQGEICDDYRASDDDDQPGMQITIATDEAIENWALQTGDNSYTGACYSLPHWEVIYLYRDSDVEDLAKSAIGNLIDTALESAYWNSTATVEPRE